MEENHKLALYVTNYLARFDKVALENLGFKNWETAFSRISDKLHVKKHSVRNWRDEFDPLFGYRAGWYQRPMSPSRANVALALEGLDESEIRTIVEDILSGKIENDTVNLNQLLKIADEISDNEKKSYFILRGPTGKKAEQFFIEQHRKSNLPFNGELRDTRDLGCGYDFEIKSSTELYFIEVKGLSSERGGILFTNKEWETAKKYKENYVIALVSNIDDSPEIRFISNPAETLNPKRNMITTIQTQWSVSNTELNNA